MVWEHVLDAFVVKGCNHRSHVHNKRVCKDGPVFRAEEVEL